MDTRSQGCHHCTTNIQSHSHIHTHTTVLLLFWNMSGNRRVNRYQKSKTRKVKTNLDLLEQERVSGSGICWAICKSATHPRQPRQHPTTQFFIGRIPFLPPNQQHQSTEGIAINMNHLPASRNGTYKLHITANIRHLPASHNSCVHASYNGQCQTSTGFT